jgi:ribosomal protein S18 acetylase RimI-like enzyme
VPLIELRPATPEDEPFLRELYFSTRREEVAAWGWDEAQQAAFLDQQYAARRFGEQQLAAALRKRIILCDGRPAGVLATVDHHRSVELHDIALLPHYRGQGVGTDLLRAEIAAAATSGRSLFLYALSGGPALRLYARLGLRLVEDDGIYTLMTT